MSRSTYIMPFLIHQEATKSKPCSRPMSLSSPSLSAPPPPPPGGSSREGSTNRPDHMYVSAHWGRGVWTGTDQYTKLQAWVKVTTIPYVTKWQQFHTWQSGNNFIRDKNSNVIVTHLLCKSKTSFTSDNQRYLQYKTLSWVATAGPAPYCSLLGGFPRMSPANHHRPLCAKGELGHKAVFRASDPSNRHSQNLVSKSEAWNQCGILKLNPKFLWSFPLTEAFVHCKTSFWKG